MRNYHAQSGSKLKRIRIIFYMLDTLLFILNDGCFLEQEERMQLLKLIQRNQILRQEIIRILESADFAQDWDVFDITLDDLKVRVLEERDAARARLDQLFYNDGDFLGAVQSYCPALLQELSDLSLRGVVRSNPSGIAVVADKSLAARLSRLLQIYDITRIFTIENNSEQGKAVTLRLLDYCHEYFPGVLTIILRSIHTPARTEADRKIFSPL